ncbi:Rpl39 [Trichosporon asahii var. asahii CBS 8904]|uniref:Large ribosomal subunit protein eL39 n=1 Tax=Trichosporon asahii var. asahii (strain CBS 8904) TaxID=1220162 RepID=K1V4G7_TRIAC|nr:Rpl39 [Trichosporon asahii var. asahii CBS 8904]
MPSQKSFIVKQKLAKKARQNRPIPQWFRLKTDRLYTTRGRVVWLAPGESLSAGLGRLRGRSFDTLMRVKILSLHSSPQYSLQPLARALSLISSIRFSTSIQLYDHLHLHKSARHAIFLSTLPTARALLVRMNERNHVRMFIAVSSRVAVAVPVSRPQAKPSSPSYQVPSTAS